MIGTWTLRDEDERSSLAYLIANAPADGRYLVTITEAAMTTDDLFQPTPDDWETLRAENAELRRQLAEWQRKSDEVSTKIEQLLQRLDEGDVPL